MWPGGIGILHVYLPPAELDVNFPFHTSRPGKARQGNFICVALFVHEASKVSEDSSGLEGIW